MPLEVASPGLAVGERPDPCAIVLFGASGDLGTRELVPSLFELYAKSLLPQHFAIVGVARSEWSHEEYRDRMCRSVEENCSVGCDDFETFARHLYYVAGDVGDNAAYTRLAEELDGICESHEIPGNLVFHLALPPRFFPDAVRGLAAAGLARSDRGWRRLVIEKPFGSDYESARALDAILRATFDEEQIYRVDHFLGKETVQNMLAFRFANAAFEPVWNSNYIDHVQITVAEDIGIGDRAGFYEETGVIRDMVQNHLLQLVCMTALEPPVQFDARSLRDETAKVLQAINVQPVDLETGVVTGQYGPGEVDGRMVHGYREEKDVDAESRTPTFAALELSLDNSRWAGVPFYLRTGKRLKRKLTEVAIQFAPTHHHVFPRTGAEGDAGNLLRFRLQPDEAIDRTFLAKRPGPGFVLEEVRMHFDYAEAFGIEHPPRAYAWLLHDAMRGDQTLFARSDWILEAWRVVDPVIAQWEDVMPPSYPNYAAGSWGPEAADELVRRNGREWLEAE